MTNVALVAGAGGAASKRLIELLRADPDWSVIALARSPRRSGDRLTPVCVDLLDRAACARALASHRGVTHVFYTARAKHGESGVEEGYDLATRLGYAGISCPREAAIELRYDANAGISNCARDGRTAVG